MIITSKLLSSQTNIVHGISTKTGGEPPYYNNLSKHVGDEPEMVKKNRKRFFGSLGIDETSLVHANQVHSDGVTVVNSPGLYPNTDALITQKAGLYLVISVADCMPIMIYDPERKVIANVHSGWRGTQKNITGKTIGVMIKEFGSKTADMIVFTGPAISKKNFEVDKDVADLFDKKYVEAKTGKAAKTGTAGKFVVDTGMIVYDSLINTGVMPGNIESYPLCTYDEAEMLHSYRRDRNLSGRMFAVIGMK